MTEFRSPRPGELPQLRGLWKHAFGESEAFLDLFFSAAFLPLRCRVAAEDGTVAAMLYWLDCVYQGKKVAYLYGVATAQAYRGRGLATALLEDTHAHMEDRCYACALLVPAGEALFRFYAQRGYHTVGFLSEQMVRAVAAPIAVRELPAGDYAAARLALLPENPVIQEGDNLALLEGYARFFAGDGWCAVYTPGEAPVIAEFLGDRTALPRLLTALGLKSALVRGPGRDKPFAMARALAGPLPKELYFAFAFD